MMGDAPPPPPMGGAPPPPPALIDKKLSVKQANRWQKRQSVARGAVPRKSTMDNYGGLGNLNGMLPGQNPP
jgi:hypothetical protein